jgi:hypothetical protein
MAGLSARLAVLWQASAIGLGTNAKPCWLRLAGFLLVPARIDVSQAAQAADLEDQ